MGRKYLGLAHTFHDSALAIVDASGEVLFAEATERYLQNKRAMNVRPDLFLRTGELLAQYCDPGDEIVPAYSWSDWYSRQLAEDTARFHEYLEQMHGVYGGELPDFMGRITALQAFMLHSQTATLTQSGCSLEYEIGSMEQHKLRLLPARRYYHHLTHAAASCFSSTFQQAVCAVVDVQGEDSAFACYDYRDGKLSPIDTVKATIPSLGSYYMEVCAACGFGEMRGEEWKVMGLAAYGEHDEGLYGIFSRMIRAQGIGFEGPTNFALMQLRRRLHGLRRKPGTPAVSAKNIAYAGQKVFNDVLCEFLEALQQKTGAENLVLTGGCALNSSTNGRILESTSFKELFVFCAPADDGNAIGAALLAQREDHPEQPAAAVMQTPYTGSSLSQEALEHVRQFGPKDKMTECGGDAPERAARLLAEGKIIGWIQGRAEFGPRALGNRSILADPRSPSIKEIINARVKFREEFRPFAPVILDEYGKDYFIDYRPAPYMERTLRFRPEVVAVVPGVVHRDGTGRLQTVRKEWNELFYRLVRRFHDLTNVPVVLNTSFNVMGKPIAHSVEDVLAVFYTSGLDAVFIGDLLLEK